MPLLVEHISWLKLATTPHIGAKRFLKLINYFGSASKVLEADNNEWLALKMPIEAVNNRRNRDEKQLDMILQWLEENNHYLLTLHDENYPHLLKEIANPPPFLLVKGRIDILNFPQIAIVGSRNPSNEGLYHANEFAHALSENGFVVTSGLALGIDGLAHQACVNLKNPTVAVLGTGLHHIYPKRHISLANDIVECGGALVSEFLLDTPPIAENFPRRNRIISGLSLGTLVVEAAKQSGSLITARLSNEQNRDVFVIPGSIQNANTKGCHQLIKEGAALVETTQDILDALAHWGSDYRNTADLAVRQKTLATSTFSKQGLQKSQQVPLRFQEQNTPLTHVPALKLAPPQDETQLQILSHIKSNSLVSVDTLAIATKLSATEITQHLLMLEIEGYIQGIPGGKFKLL